MAKNGKKRPAAAGGEKPKACYVLSLSVENVRCFGPKQTLDLSDGHGRPAPWTIILGENGTGKTTLLQSLVCVDQVPYLAYGNEPVIWNTRPRLFAHQMGVKFSPGKAKVDPATFLRGQVGRVDAKCEIVYTRSNDLLTKSTTPPAEATWTVRSAGSSSQMLDFMVVGYGASRRLAAATLHEAEFDDPVGSLFDAHASLRNSESWLLRLDYAASKETADTRSQRTALAKVQKLLTDGLLPGINQVSFTPTVGMNPTPYVELHHEQFGWVPLRQLGYGYQTVFAWVLDFVSRMVERNPDSPDPLKEPAICVVDEIDLHLHPAWQRKLIGFLSERFPNTQFIATAHSPLVVQAAENANIAVLKREGDHVVIHNDVDNIRNWRVDQILTSDLFGLESARSPEVEKLFVRNEELLAKTRLTAKEKQELKEIERKIEALPTWANPGERRDSDTIKAILERLDKSPK